MYCYILVVQLVNFVQGAPVNVAPQALLCGFKTVPIYEDGAQMHGVVWKS